MAEDVVLDTSIRPSVCHSKRMAFAHLGGALHLYAPKYAQYGLCRIKATYLFRSSYSLMHVGDDGVSHFVELKVPSGIYDRIVHGKSSHRTGFYIFQAMDDNYYAAVVDALCRISNNGDEIFINARDPISKIPKKVVLLKAYEGSKLLIDADLHASKYHAYDEPLDLPF